MEKKKAASAIGENNSIRLAYADVSFSGDEASFGKFNSERLKPDTEDASVGGLLHEGEGNSFRSKVVPLTDTENPPVGNRPYENEWE